MPLVKKLKTYSFTYPVFILEKDDSKPIIRQCSHCSKDYETIRENLRVDNLCVGCR